MVQRFTMDHKNNIYKVCLRTIVWLTVESGRLLTSAGQALRKSRRQWPVEKAEHAITVQTQQRELQGRRGKQQDIVGVLTKGILTIDLACGGFQKKYKWLLMTGKIFSAIGAGMN
jgi:hypothetical protein